MEQNGIISTNMTVSKFINDKKQTLDIFKLLGYNTNTELYSEFVKDDKLCI